MGWVNDSRQHGVVGGWLDVNVEYDELVCTGSTARSIMVCMCVLAL